MGLPNENANRDKRANNPIFGVYIMISILNERKCKSEIEADASVKSSGGALRWNRSLRSRWNEIRPLTRTKWGFHRCRRFHLPKVDFTRPKDGFRWKNLASARFFLAGVAGFEPTHAAVKVLCLTAWRHPNIIIYSCKPKKILVAFATKKKVGWKMGLEPTISGATNQRFNQLSYIHRNARIIIS